MGSSRVEVASLMYHEVTDRPGRSGFQRPGALPYTISCGTFHDHLTRIAAGGLAPELVTDIHPVAGGRHLLLTFDDGGRSAREAALMLELQGWRGHFFVVTSLVGQRGFLTADDIRDLRTRGHVIGTHSHTHPDIFRALSRARMVAEWRTSADYLEDVLGEPCLAGSVPGGDISAAALESAGEAGLRFLFTSEPWIHPLMIGGCWVFGRYGVKAATSAVAVADLAGFRGWGRARLERQLKVLARLGLGPVYRWYVRRTTRPWGAVTAPGG